MKIALIHCPFGHRIFSENVRVVDEEFCLAPPLILAYVAAILERAGHTVLLVDANALKLTKEKTLQIVRNFNPDILGFRAETYWFHRVVEWATFLKDALRLPVLVGGVNITLYPHESFSYGCFDYGVIGEANEALPLLLSALEHKTALSAIPGVIYRRDGQPIANPPAREPVAFDSYPFPARHLLPNHLYYSFTSQLRNFTIMVTSTGCPFKCTFCAISRLAYRERSPLNVVDEVEDCYKRFKVREIDFFDATFFINKQRSLAICEEMQRRGLKIEWSCRSRTDVVDEEVLRVAARAGCKKIYYGIESASEPILEKVNKQIDRAQIVRAIELTRKCGIKSLGFFMVGNPLDTAESIASSIAFAKSLPLDFIQVCRAIAKPNTELNDYLIKASGVDYWREYILGKAPEARLPTPWTVLSAYEVEQHLKHFYNAFYFRPRYLFMRITRIRSFRECLRYIKVALRWFFANRSDVQT